jgi:hypothetical protein
MGTKILNLIVWQFQQLGSLTCLTLHYPNTSNAYDIQSYCCLAVQTNLQTVAKYAAKTCNSVEAGRTYNCIFLADVSANTPTHAESKT